MKKIGILFLFLNAAYYNFVAGSTPAWISDPFQHFVFIENKGQCDIGVCDKQSVSHFYANSNGVDIYFFPNGLTYGHTEYRSLYSEEERARIGQECDGDNKKEKEVVSSYLQVEWVGGNPAAKIEGSEVQPFYYLYPGGSIMSQTTIKASCYKKITYKNLYPNIDVEYILPEKGGVKYSLILHPGSDVSQVKLRYINAKKLNKDKDGNMCITSEFGDFIDYAPISYYKEGGAIRSSFELKGNAVSFKLNASDFTLRSDPALQQTIIIDPWTVNPAFPFNKAFDVNYDLAGNVFVYGSYSPYKLAKFNSAGALQWIRNIVSSDFYTDFAVDENTGRCYVMEYRWPSPSIYKFDPLGNLIGTYTLPASVTSQMNELWRCEYNRCSNKIVIGGGSVNGPYQAAMLDTSLTTMTPFNVYNETSPYVDVVMLATDPNGLSCYMIVSTPTTSPLKNNNMVKCPIPGLFPTTYMVNSGYSFKELASVSYYPPWGTQFSNPFNGMVCGLNFLYTYDGTVLKQWNKNSGTLIAQVNTGGKMFANGGITVDKCDNVYVGVGAKAVEYNSSLILMATYTVSDTCYDLKLGPNNKLYACGKGFVAEISVHDNPQTITTSTTPSASVGGCSACNGTATVNGLGCSNPYIKWSDGQTTTVATGLCAGTYTVTVSNNCLESITAIATVTGGSGNSLALSQSIYESCIINESSATIVGTGGTLPYNYLWSTGQTTSTTTGLSPGVYSITVTDAAGCNKTASITITGSFVMVMTTSQSNITCTTSGSAGVNVTTGAPQFSYSWSNGGTTSAINGLATGGYTVTITDGNSCTVTRSFAITGSSLASATFTQSPGGTICIGNSVTFTNTGTTGTYGWLISPGTPTITGSTANFSNTFLSAGTFTVTHTVNTSGCTNRVTSIVTVINCSGPIVSATGSSVCPGICATVNASGSGGSSPYTYSWSNGSTGQNISPCPASATTYTVTITDTGGNTSTSSAVVTINPAVSISTMTTNINCSGASTGSATAAGSNGTPGYTYLWSNLVSGSQVSGLASGTYTVTVTDSKGCTSTSSATIISPPALVGLFTKGTTNCTGCGQAGGCKQWLMINATGGTSPYSYTWPDGYDKRYKNRLCPGNYTVNIKDKNGCSINMVVNTP